VLIGFDHVAQREARVIDDVDEIGEIVTDRQHTVTAPHRFVVIDCLLFECAILVRRSKVANDWGAFLRA